MAQVNDRGPERRQLLTGIAAAAGAAIASVATGSSPAQAGHDATNVFHLGETNQAGAATTALEANPAGAALKVNNTFGPGGSGLHVTGSPAIEARSATDANSAIIAVLEPTTPSALGNSCIAGINRGNGEGVFGMGATGGVTGLARIPGPNPGTFTAGTGVYGKSGSGAGVQGESQSGPGVLGNALQAGATGVEAKHSLGGLALDVGGKARFSTAGVGTIPAGSKSTTLVAPVSPATSVVLVTPMADPRDPLYVQIGAGSFTVNVDHQAKTAIPFGWLAVEHA